jgi:hypothetical protein
MATLKNLSNMKRYFITTFIFFSLFSSCNKSKSYKYVEIVEEEGLLGGTDTKEKEAKTIKASTDSSAYLQAYQNFCVSLKVNKDMKQSLGKVYSTPTKFELYDSKGVEITNSVLFADKDKREKEIEDKIFSMRNNIQESVDKNKQEKIESFNQTAKVDSAKVKNLEKFFRIKSDEFSNDNKKWYKPKSAPNYTNANGIYCYFQTENGMPGNLRFRLQYYADEWLFFNRVQFSIDGKAYEYIPLNTETDSGNGGYIWEWFDESVSDSDKELINALANAKSAKMKLIGRQYFDTKNITQEQISSFKRTLELYQAMGGQW